MITAAGEVDLARILVDLLVILATAKVAAELAERVRLPAVIGEIVAGVVVGPSGFGLVQLTGDRGTAVTLLAEIGVLLLLLGVGMEMDLGELGRVGGAAMAVAVTGVILPFAGGTAVGLGVFDDVGVAVFVGAALTATSVGITARVFGDLRALASVEARIVLGAAVADDVIGLVILTVVSKVVAGGSVTVGSVATTLGLAGLFLVGAGAVAVVGFPRLFRLIGKASSPSTPAVAAMVLMLGLAALADRSGLAFIIGAFVAGLALRRTDHHERIAGELNSVGTVLVPVFFVTIGLRADLGTMARPRVIAIALALTAVAVAGKVAAGWAVRGRAVDRLLVGLGMIPRGEVGLIFASIGLSGGVLNADEYGALIMVVLLTTVITPPLIRLRLGAPPTGAVVAATAEDGDWNPADTAELVALLRTATPRTWRLLESTGVLDRAVPELASALRRRRAEMNDLAPLGSVKATVVERLLRLPAEEADLAIYPVTDPLLVAALVLDAADEPAQRRVVANRLAGPQAAGRVMAMIDDARLLHGRATLQLDVFDEAEVIQLAAHLGTSAQARDAYLLALATAGNGSVHRAALDGLFDRVTAVLAQSRSLGTGVAAMAAERLAAAGLLIDDPQVAERLAHTPHSHLLASEPDDLARQAALIEPLPPRRVVRVAVTAHPLARRWVIDVACRDSPGLLARLADVLLERGLEVLAADVATWPDGGVVDRFTVASGTKPDAASLAAAFQRHLTARLHAVELLDAELAFDNEALPWHTSCVITGPARIAAFRAIAHAFAVAGVAVHAARLDSDGLRFTFRFWLADRVGRKLSTAHEARVRRALSAGRRPTRSQQLETSRQLP